METLKPPEGRKLVIIAKCENCSWRSSLSTTTLRLAADSGSLQDIAKQHELKYNHTVVFKMG